MKQINIFTPDESPVCSAAGCFAEPLNNGFCNDHQQIEFPEFIPSQDQVLAQLQADLKSRITIDPETKCWNWTQAKDSRGYGFARDKQAGKQDYAHRVSYRLFNGEIPSGQVVRHDCDNASCINPDHLTIGSHKDNSADMVLRDRCRKSASRRPRLSSETVKAIKSAIKNGASSYSIAKKYKISEPAVSLIRRGRRFRDIIPDSGYDLRKSYAKTHKPGRRPKPKAPLSATASPKIDRKQAA